MAKNDQNINKGMQERIAADRALRASATEINELLENNVQLQTQITLKSKENVSFAMFHKTISRDTIKILQKQVNSLKNKLEFEQEVLERTEEIRKNETIISKVTDKIRESWLEMRAIAADLTVATGVWGAAITREAGKLITSITEAQDEIGLLGSQALQLSDNIGAAGIQGVFLGYGFGEASEAAAALVMETKDLSLITTKNVKTLAKWASYYGISVESTAKLERMFTEVEGMTLKSYMNLIKMKGAIAGLITEDIAGHAEYFALYTKNGGRNIINAAEAAQRLGIDLSEVESIASNLLDFDASINAEMQLSAFLGRQINFNQARQLAFTGDHDAMLKEVLNTLGGIDEWNKLDVIRKRKVSETIGVSVDKLQTMIAQQDDLIKQSEMQETLWGKIALGIKGGIKGLGNFKALLLSSGNLAFAMKNNFIALKGISGALGGPFKKLSGGISKFFGATAKAKGVTKVTEGVSKTSGMFTKLQANYKGILAGGAAMAMMAGSLWILSKALMGFKALGADLWPMLAAAGVALLGFTIALAAVGAIMMSGVGAVAIIAGAGAMAIMAGTLWILGKALQEIATPMDMLSIGIGNLAMNVGILPKIGSGFASMAGGIVALAGSMLLLTPFLPGLLALSTIGGTVTTKTATTGTKTSNEDITNELKMIRALIEQGANINIDKNKVGSWLGKYYSTVRSIENK